MRASKSVIFAAVLCLFVVVVTLSTVRRRERRTERLAVAKPVSALNKRTKCVSCEHDLPPEKSYLAQPSKCFSCEQQLRDSHPFAASGTIHTAA
jgi:uncharacterized paraquat-inducible protein A